MLVLDTVLLAVIVEDLIDVFVIGEEALIDADALDVLEGRVDLVPEDEPVLDFEEDCDFVPVAETDELLEILDDEVMVLDWVNVFEEDDEAEIVFDDVIEPEILGVDDPVFEMVDVFVEVIELVVVLVDVVDLVGSKENCGDFVNAEDLVDDFDAVAVSVGITF